MGGRREHTRTPECRGRQSTDGTQLGRFLNRTSVNYSGVLRQVRTLATRRRITTNGGGRGIFAGYCLTVKLSGRHSHQVIQTTRRSARSAADVAMAAEDQGVAARSEGRVDSRQSTDNHSTTAHNLVATETETIPAKQLGHDGEGPA